MITYECTKPDEHEVIRIMSRCVSNVFRSIRVPKSLREDARQEAIMMMWKAYKANKIDWNNNPVGYLYRIAYNAILAMLYRFYPKRVAFSRSKRVSEVSVYFCDPDYILTVEPSDFGVSVSGTENKIDYDTVVSSLPSEYKSIVLLWSNGGSLKVYAKETNQTYENVRYKLCRAINKLVGRYYASV